MPAFRPGLRQEKTGALQLHGLDPAALFSPLLPFSRIGLAVSGGPDSLALMLLAAGWAKANGKMLIVYTVDHGLRPEAPAECDMVAHEAEKLGLPCRKLAWTGTKPETGVQAAARLARYRLIGDAMRVDGTEILVTAHHIDDQAETVLMRMAHGSGVGGLAGMALFGTVEGVRLCRPLLAVERMHLRDVVREAGITAAADPSNTDEHYERVRWRHVLPGLAKEGLDPERLATLATRMARADAALASATDEACDKLVEFDRFGVASLAFADWDGLPEEIGLRLLERVLAWAGGGTGFKLSQIETAGAALRTSATGHAATLCGAALTRAGETVQIFREIGRMVETAPVLLESGASMIFDGRFKISCAETGQAGFVLAPAGEALTRAEAEALAGPIGVPMRAVAAAPALRDGDGRLVAIGAISAAGASAGIGIEVLRPAKPAIARQ